MLFFPSFKKCNKNGVGKETARKKMKEGIYLTLSIVLDRSLTCVLFSTPVKNVMIINFLHKYK